MYTALHGDASYDTNQDSVVRTKAAEVRKRLAQYYLEPEHQHELRLSLPAGCYVAGFRAPVGSIPLLPAPVERPRAPGKRRQKNIQVVLRTVMVGRSHVFLVGGRACSVKAIRFH
jgi:hypothetical protein